jgi:hypothetical protein
VAVNADIEGQNLTLQRKTLQVALDEVKALGNGGSYAITLTGDETDVPAYDGSGFTTPITITVNGGGHNITMSNSATTHYITVKSGVTLIIKNITLTGANTSMDSRSLVYIESGGVFKMESGTLTKNITKEGAAVYVNEGASFVMEGGTITGNSLNNTSDGGGGVRVKGSMTMSGGSITGNGNKNNHLNDVSINPTGSLTLSGSASIGRIWLKASGDSNPSITIPGAFSGQNIIIDLYSASIVANLVDKQILKGDGLSNAISKFSLGRGCVSPVSANAASSKLDGSNSVSLGNLTEAGFFIDSGGYLRLDLDE